MKITFYRIYIIDWALLDSHERNKEMRLFSVIIPHYNSVFLLKHLISSIPVEASIQLIVVDDKSTEDVTEAERLVTARGGLFLYNVTGKKGAGTCRNIGLEHADGKWLVFADADDFFLKNAFEIMKEHANSDADIIHFIPTSKNLKTMKTDTRHLWCEKLVRRYLDDPIEENEMALRYRCIVPWSKMIRHSMVKDAGILFDEVIVSNDVMFSVKCGHYAKCVEACAEKIYCVTRSENTLTTGHDEERVQIRATLYKSRYQFLKDHLDLKKYSYTMPLSGQFLVRYAQQGYSLKLILKLYRYFRQEKIPLINWAGIRYTLRHQLRERRLYRDAYR